MKLIVVIFTAFVFAIVSPAEKVYSQTTTVSKRCGKCGKSVSASSKVGDVCPHCGVRWGYENTSTSTSSRTTTSTEPYLDYYTPRTTKSKVATNKSASSTKAVTKAKPNPFATYTKEQTETWLLEKLTAYAQKRAYFFDNTYYITEDDYEFNLDGNYLIAKYNYNNSYDEVFYIPLYDYDELGEKYGTFSISTASSTMYAINKSTNLKRATNYLTIGFRNDAESNFMFFNGVVNSLLNPKIK